LYYHVLLYILLYPYLDEAAADDKEAIEEDDEGKDNDKGKVEEEDTVGVGSICVCKGTACVLACIEEGNVGEVDVKVEGGTEEGSRTQLIFKRM
jgi:hypothetical protein